MTTTSLALKRLRQPRRGLGGVSVTGAVALAYITVLLVFALAAPLIAPYGPDTISSDILAPPSAAHLWGTDGLGRDVLSGVIFGSRLSLTVGLSAAIAATLIGVTLGAYAGFRGGLVDMAVMRVAEMFQVFPSLILAALVLTMLGPGIFNVVLVIVILSWPQTARLARSEAMRLKSMDYVNAARCLGHGRVRILLSEIIPNLLGPVVAMGTLVVAEAALMEASLSFLGLSAQGDISWGRMLHEGWQSIFTSWWLSVYPGTAIFLTILAFNLLGDALSRRGEGE